MSTSTPSGTPSNVSSPTRSQHNGLPQQLTPRSKIKVLLAAVDNSDEDPSPVTTRAIGGIGEKCDTSTPENQSNADELPKRQARLSARLERKQSTADESSSSGTACEEDMDDGNAYERIKTKLMSKVNSDSKSGGGRTQEQESADDEDEGPILSHRRKVNTKGRLQSPSSIPDRSRQSSPLFLSSGPGSKNASPSKAVINNDSDSDLPANPETNDRFLALVARKRAERQAKEAAEAEKRAMKETQYRRASSRRSITPLGDSENETDNVGAKKLTQQARPTRKASKKALEEMNRETQRMNRNMQLAHQARTKKKITKESLFARFNFRTTNTPDPEAQKPLSSSTGVSSGHQSETEAAHHQDTPPTSPAPDHSPAKFIVTEPAADEKVHDASVDQNVMEDEEMPTVDDIMNQPRSPKDKGKGKANDDGPSTEKPLPVPQALKTDIKKQIRVRLPKPSVKSKNRDSDSDLEILPARKSTVAKLDGFNPMGKVSEARSLQTLRALAHLNSPERRSGKSRASMTSSEMYMSLQQRARKQAAAERAEKIQDLKNRGIIVQTAEERQKDQVEVEDLVEKARQEAADIKKMEKDAAKKEAKRNGESFDDSSENDEDYQANEADESDIELSGSEEEALAESEDELANGEAGSEGEAQLDESGQADRFVEHEAMEDVEEREASEGTVEVDSASDQEEVNLQPRRVRANRIIDEDDEAATEKPEASPNLNPFSETPQKPTVPAIAFGTSLGLMGMTQAFAATMADSQTQARANEGIDVEQDSMDFLGSVPEPNIPLYDTNDLESMIPDSQADVGPDTNVSDIKLNFTQSQIDEQTPQHTQDQMVATQDSELPDPTQDMGFHLLSPALNRFVSPTPSTVDTVLLPESPAKRRKGRLQRGRKASIGALDVEGPLAPLQTTNAEILENAFDVMKRQRKDAATAFDKKKSNAKEMVEEQAQESEDEYAGIGGASDDESAGEEDEEIKNMIEEGDVEVDERKLAAYYADKERASDEQAISKLYKDLQNGGLRRKRGGADFELSDSDDDDQARRRAKQRQFAKMRKALLADEKLGKIAEDPKKMAFLRALEDREDQDDLDVSWDGSGVAEDGEAQSTQEVADSQAPEAPQAGTKRKRPLQESLPDAANRPPPAARRTKSKKPATLAEIRESVSFLIETPESMSFQSHAESSDIEDEDENENDQAPTGQASNDIEKDTMPPPPLPQRNNPRRTPAPIIDRLSLKRAASAESHAAANGTRLAFMAPSTATSIFHVPSLLRRASTSNLANAQNNNHGITTLAATEQAAGGGDAKGAYVKKGGKKGSILGQAREMERRAVLDAGEKRRREERERVAKCRRSGFLRAEGNWEG